MDFGSYQDNYQFVFLFLLICLFGGIVAGMLLGYLWIQLRKLGTILSKQLNPDFHENHAQVLTHPYFRKDPLVGCGVAHSWKLGSGEHVSLHSA